MRRILANVVWALENLFAGFRLAMPARVSRRSFHFSDDQALILLVLASGVTLLVHYPFGATDVHLTSYSWTILAARCFFVFLLYYLVARLQHAAHTLPALAVALLSASIALNLSQRAIAWVASLPAIGLAKFAKHGVVGTMVFVITMVWGFAVIARAVRLVYHVGWVRVGLFSAAILLGWFALGRIAPPYFWDVPPPREEADSRPRINTEWTYYAQSRLLSQKLDALAPSRSGISELYFLGFAGTATQDVFMKEVRSARALFDERFDTRDRSLILVNNPRTVEELPVASVSNLYWALKGVARKMHLDDDILFLYLTSHGSPHMFAVDFPQLALNNLRDGVLKDMLDRAGIKWRIVVISACYSGSFIEMLKDDHSLIITAAAEDRTSFGCSNENDFTYFGDAYIDTALRRERSFIAAFETATEAIAAREKAEKLTPSEPQIYVGKAMRAKLDKLEQRLASLPSTAAALKTESGE